jgi:hypothetical protein
MRSKGNDKIEKKKEEKTKEGRRIRTVKRIVMVILYNESNEGLELFFLQTKTKINQQDRSFSE